MSFENDRITININTSGNPIKVPYDPKNYGDASMIKSSRLDRTVDRGNDQSRIQSKEDEKPVPMDMAESEIKGSMLNSGMLRSNFASPTRDVFSVNTTNKEPAKEPNGNMTPVGGANQGGNGGDDKGGIIITVPEKRGGVGTQTKTPQKMMESEMGGDKYGAGMEQSANMTNSEMKNLLMSKGH